MKKHPKSDAQYTKQRAKRTKRSTRYYAAPLAKQHALRLMEDLKQRGKLELTTNTQLVEALKRQGVFITVWPLRDIRNASYGPYSPKAAKERKRKIWDLQRQIERLTRELRIETKKQGSWLKMSRKVSR